MTPLSLNLRTPVTVVALSALLALAACGKKEASTTTMPPSTPPANTAAPAVTQPMPDTPPPASTGSTGGMATPTPGAATGSVPNNDSSPAPVAPASAVR